MTPEDLLNHLCHTSPRQRKTLEAIFAVCKEIVDLKILDFSYAAIARAGASRGVPKAQSIRNKTGENYQALIKCFEDTYGTSKGKKKSGGAQWADDIKDPKQRILTHQLMAELSDAKKIIKEWLPPGTVIRVDDRSSNAPDTKLSDLERRAIQHLLSDEFLDRWQLKLGAKGEVLDSNGKVVFKPGTAQAISKILKLL